MLIQNTNLGGDFLSETVLAISNSPDPLLAKVAACGLFVEIPFVSIRSC